MNSSAVCQNLSADPRMNSNESDEEKSSLLLIINHG